MRPSTLWLCPVTVSVSMSLTYGTAATARNFCGSGWQADVPSLLAQISGSCGASPMLPCHTQTCCGWDRQPLGGSWWARHTRMIWLA